MKKYGLQLRVPPGQHKQKTASNPPLPPSAFAFRDDDEDDVEKEISRQAAKNKALQKVEEQHKKALEEDPSVFDYDGVYDEMKEKVARPRIQDRTERKSKYIETLMEKAKAREREHEIVYERKLLKERSKEDHLFEDKERFVTSAYKKQLAERAKWLEEERLQQIREQKDDVTKKSDLSEFYFGLNKNVAFGARSEEEAKQRKHKPSNVSSEGDDGGQSPAEASAPKRERCDEGRPSLAEGSAPKRERADDRAESRGISESHFELPATSSEVVAVPDAPSGEKKEEGALAAEVEAHQQYKRGEDAVAAARERYLARKKARAQ